MGKINSDKIFLFFVYVILGALVLVMAYPIWFVLIASVSDPTYVNLGQVLLFPKGLTLEGYRKVFEYRDLMTGYKNTILYTVVGTSINLAVLMPASFALSRRELCFRNFFMIFFLITMYVGGGLVPGYLQVKNLGLMNTMWALVLPGAFSVYNMIICRNYFTGNISEELFDSARIDGSSYTGFFLSVVLPLSKSIIAVMVLFHALGHWNSYLSALYYLRDTDKYPLQLVLRNMQTELDAMTGEGGAASMDALMEIQRLQQSVKYAIIPMASVPVALMYPLVQKHFVKGVMIGSIKG